MVDVEKRQQNLWELIHTLCFVLSWAGFLGCGLLIAYKHWFAGILVLLATFVFRNKVEKWVHTYSS
jgi:hypothetical protein